jgi:hypothetical protein
MQYVLLIYDEGSANPSAPPPPDDVMAGVMDAYDRFTKECRDRGVYVAGEALQNIASATTVRVRDGQTLTTDGPFAETKEALGGFYLLECRDLDEALEFAARCPAAALGSVEVRPVWDYAGASASEVPAAAAGAGA